MIGHRPHEIQIDLLCMSGWAIIIIVKHIICDFQHISENVEAMKAVPHQILPDVGMVTTYPKCVLKPANVDLDCYNVTDTPPFSWTFCASWFFHVAIHGFRDAGHHLYICTRFCGKCFYSPCFCAFYGVQAAWHANTSFLH